MGHRTITLTDRPPIRVDEDLWPVIAQAKDDSYSSRDYSRYQQAKAQGELDEYALRVRRHHMDGRVVVYGVLDAATVWTGTEDWRGGEVLPEGATGHAIAGAIRRVGKAGGFPDKVIRECIAALPAEEV